MQHEVNLVHAAVVCSPNMHVKLASPWAHANETVGRMECKGGMPCILDNPNKKAYLTAVTGRAMHTLQARPASTAQQIGLAAQHSTVHSVSAQNHIAA